MNPPEHQENKIAFHSLGSGMTLTSLLESKTPAFRAPDEVFVQLQYLEGYIRRPDLNSVTTERTVAVESHYIDRDFMADHCVLFASTLRAPENYCRRLHFFAASPEAVEVELQRIRSILFGGGEKAEENYDHACKEFSQRYYLGFAVVRPLPACPVGRTVLRVLPREKPEDQTIRVMACVRDYPVHFMGAVLTVTGLGFQQQDLGVSRCSTIALWCALHKAGDGEGIPSATPAEITNHASKYSLPFGRSMPSEGLAIDQMCFALNSLGMAPFLARVQSFTQGRGLIYSATRSGMPCVLVIQKADESDVWHAVTVAGMKIRAKHEPSIVRKGNKSSGDDMSGDLKALYVHDDRIGPYRRAEVIQSPEGQLRLQIKV